jgi:peptide deformylase
MERILLTVPDTRLRQKSESVKEVDAYVKELAQFLLGQLDLRETADLVPVGFAAAQYGELIRLIVIRFRGIEKVFVNPEIVKRSEKTYRATESCMSIPGRYFYVERPKIVKVKGLNLDGKWHSLKGHDVLAQILCHEIDHCDGVLIDRIGQSL